MCLYTCTSCVFVHKGFILRINKILLQSNNKKTVN